MHTSTSAAERALLPGGAFLLGAGAAAGCTAFATYITRYSRFDALMGEIDGGLYRRITTVAPAEWAAASVGAVLVVLGIAALVAAAVLRRRGS